MYLYDDFLVLGHPNSETDHSEARLLELALTSVTSEHSRRSYRTGLIAFFAWVRGREAPVFSKALVQAYRAGLVSQDLAASTINLRLAPIRKLAREMADNGMLEQHAAAAIERVPGVQQLGTRAGNWLTKEQANDLLNAPNSNALSGMRDRAILALLLRCGLRRAELLRLNVEDLQQRQSRWVIPNLLGKGKRLRLVTIPAGVKARIDLWAKAAGITEGGLFRPVNKGGVIVGDEIRDQKAIWNLVMRYAKETELGKLAPHDL